MKCPKCQAELPENAKFCNLCGQSLQTELICNQCQHLNPANSRFCLQLDARGEPTLRGVGATVGR